MFQVPWTYRGYNRRTPAMQVSLATRILDQRHEQDVIDRAKAAFGSRYSLMMPPDLSRNTLRSYCDRVCRAYTRPPFVTGLVEDLALAMGDYSASTLVDRYGEKDGRPLPTPMATTGTRALVYRMGAGYSGVLLEYSEREERIHERVIPPDEMELVWGDDSPTEPTIIRHRGERTIGGKRKETMEEYDLTDKKNPHYRVYVGNDDRTSVIFGRTFDGDGYTWRYPDTGLPFHRVVLTGDDRDPYRTNPLVEATLLVAVRWSAWGLGTDHASHPQRNVRGLTLAGMDSDGGEGGQGESGIAVGAETVLRWVDDDPEKPGTHWQDAPAYDPETLARAIRVYETTAMQALGLPVDYEATGGEPTAREQEALAELIAGTFAECRRWDGERLRRASAIAQILAQEEGHPFAGMSFGGPPFGVLYRDEITELFDKQEDTDNGRRPGPGDDREQDLNRNREGAGKE